MEPVTLLLGAAAAAGAYFGYKKITEKSAIDVNKEPGLVGPGSPGLVNALTKGRTYAITVVLDWSKIPGAVPATPDKDAMANYMKVIFGGGPGAATPDGLGFKVLSAPALRDEGEAKKFFAGQPSAWVLVGQWLKNTKTVDMTPELNKVLPTAAFFLLPVG
jgi:hypothetical protein